MVRFMGVWELELGKKIHFHEPLSEFSIPLQAPVRLAIPVLLSLIEIKMLSYSISCRRSVSFLLFIYLFIYLFIFGCFGSSFSMRGLPLFAASRGHSSSRCAGLSLSRPLLLRSTGSRRAGSVSVAHGPSCSTACGIFPDQGSNPGPLHWQADSQPLHHQGSPRRSLEISFTLITTWKLW